VEPHFIYVIAESEAGPCKLGISNDPSKRVRQLQTGHVGQLRLWHAEPAEAAKVKSLERLLHRDLRHHRVRGEWFNLSVRDATLHIQFTMIAYDSVADLAEKVRRGTI
jgi:hypothetical protein